MTRFDGNVDGPVDGAKVEVKSLFVATKFRMASTFAKELGWALISTPRGEIVQTDELMTNLTGDYAAGDISRMTHSIPFATALSSAS